MRITNSIRAHKIPHYSIYIFMTATALCSLQVLPQFSVAANVPILMLAIQIASFVLALPSIQIDLHKLNSKVMAIWFALMLWAFISCLWSEDTALSLQRTVLIFVPCTLLIVLSFSNLFTEETFWKLARFIQYYSTTLAVIGITLLLKGTIVVSSGLATQQLHFGPITLAQSIAGVPPLVRISSLTGNPNTLAEWMMFSLPLTYTLYLARKIRKRQFYITFALQALALTLTISRTGILVALFSLALLYIGSSTSLKARLKKYSLLALIGVAVILIGYCVLSGVNATASSRFTTDLNGRQEIWPVCWQSIMDRTWTGVGFGISNEAILQPAGIIFSTHNTYLTVLSEIGVPGLLLFCLLLFVLTIKLSKLRRVAIQERGDRLPIITQCLFTLAIALSIHELAENTLLRYGFPTILFAFLIGYVIALDSNHRYPLQKSNGNCSDTTG